MAERSFAGFSYQQRLTSSVFGEVFRGQDPGGRQARIIHVEPALAALPEFGRELSRFAKRMALLDHPDVVSVQTIGQAEDRLIVVTDAAVGAVGLDDVLDRVTPPLPQPLGLAIGLRVVEGLAHAHDLGLVHGGVHPRSVLIDFGGVVKLSDFGLAWALAGAATHDRSLFAGLERHLAPELIRGGTPSIASDVYASAALLVQLLAGRPPVPGAAIEVPGALGEELERALAESPATRHASAGELRDALLAVIADQRSAVATPEDLAHAIAQLDGDDTTMRGSAAGRARGLTEVLADLDGRSAGGEARRRSPIESTPDPSHPRFEDRTHVDPRDPHEPVARGPERGVGMPEDEELTPLPAPNTGEDHTRTGIDTGSFDVWAESSERDALAAVEALAAVDALIGEPGFAVAIASPPPGAATPPEPRLTSVPREVQPARRTGLWLALSVFVAAGRALLYTEVHRRTGGAADEVAAHADDVEAAEREAREAHPGLLTIQVDQPEAAVWLSLGRTPLRTMALPSDMVHELRFELAGYRAADVPVTADRWSGDGPARKARITVTLTPGSNRALPDLPAAPATPATAGPSGKGPLEIASTPPGAEVWLLIGVTPTAELSGVEAGRGYDVKVMKRGFRPAFAAVKPADWYLAGPGSPLRPALSRPVKLEPLRPPSRRAPGRK